jgi:hypothetical protein
MLQKLLSAFGDDFKTWSGRIDRQRHGIVRDRVFFLHIPKCGGTSVTSAINRKFAPETIHHLDVLAATRVSSKLDLDLMSYRENLLLYFMANEGCRLVTGHYNWSDRAYQLYGEEWKFVTVLRHPVKKWLSQYYFNRYKDCPARHFQIDVDIDEYMDSEEGRSLGHDQVRKLSDITITEPDTMLEAALENLERFDVVGLTEHLDRFQQDFGRCFGTAIDIPRLNINPAQTRQQTALESPEIRKRVEDLCRYDMILYRAALEKLGLKTE